MKDSLKNIGEELAAKIVERLQSAEVRELISRTKAASDEDTGTFEVVITTENLDRYQEVIKLDGWDLTHYRNNPVVLWGHDHGRLIGMATSIEIIDGKMVAKGKFAPTDEGQEKRCLYDAGFLKATSVGFLEKEREGNLITRAELLEFSFVSVPANPYALSLAMEKSLSVNELVTKGILFVEKDATEEEAPTVPESEEEVEPEALVQKSFSCKAIAPIVSQLREAADALEALETQEPERIEDVPAEEPTPEEKKLDEFNENRLILQKAATVITEVLAEVRIASDRRRL